MRHRYLTSVGLAAAFTLVSWAAISIKGQTPSTARPANASRPGPAPRTPWGDPDLQGSWFVMEAVPLERSAANAGKPLLTDAEVAALDKQKAADPGRNSRSDSSTQDVSGAYNAVFNSVLRTSKRTSMIIDPPDGRIPPLTPEAQARGGRGGRGAAAPAAAPAGRGAGQPAAPAGGRGGGARGGGNDNPETVAQNPRCLGVQTPFLPLNTAFAQGTVMQIVQSPKSMGIYMEDDHAGGGNRIIYMDGRPHLPSNIRTYLGDSRGRWEGSTLVVETTNFTEPFRGSNLATFKMTERFTRVDANNLRREITFEDPTTWTRPWTVLIEMGKTSDNRHMIFESACHEGNYGLTGILIGSRKEEQAAQ